MIEHLAAHTPDSHNSSIALSGELGPRQGEVMRLGSRAITVSRIMEVLEPVQQPDNLRSTTVMDDTGNKSNNPEGSRNAELFKQAYDTAVESIEGASRADGKELDDRLVALLGTIDALSRTPYISSAPEFVELVQAARANIEQIRDYTALDGNLELDPAVAVGLSAARRQLNGTLVAYQA